MSNPAQILDVSALPPGGGFLLAPVGQERIRTPDDFTEDQRAFFRTAEQFAEERVLANAARIEKKDYPFVRQLLREAGELGLLGLDVPEAYGGLGQDETSSMLVTEAMARLGAWSVTFGAQVGIGSLPIVYFGTEAQKRRYLPKLVSGEWVAAYALSESSSGSDALGARTKAVLTPDRKHFVLNGSKQWITNAGFADVFIVFAKIDGDKFSAFIVEKGTPGFSLGAEEHKMGIRGSSTCPLIFEDAKIPAENLLGEPGKGHRIAFNILNIGRLKLGAGCVAGCRGVLQLAVEYGRDRRAFGQPITGFGLVREKLARMAALVYAGEAMSYRTTGLIDERMARSGAAHGTPAFDQAVIAAVEEYNIEASILKVWGSEALSQAADEALQIHGGYGFVEEYAIERVYRDNRVNRIFEGTNEINRMLIPGTLLKRAAKGQFPLPQLARTVGEAAARGELPRPGPGPLARERRLAELNKHLMVYALQAAVETFGPALSEKQEVLGALADVAIEAYAVDSAVARALQSARDGRVEPVAEACVKLYAVEAHERAYAQAKRALRATVTDVAACREHLGRLRKLFDEDPADLTALREIIVTKTLEAGKYPLGWA
ncbi:acyl-CoA dehydrogenase family protein [Anaeromyxobacter diazotrophicus]|uniref:Acyl-CoA dehydrogenase n=1 Tax=Anaeromyxobacter diazotrophicus TaxID=2590199 RepID=A0A7I9VGU6_9BACT|nr:acyl-CoA dehydrogenase family protein [Anaeromyxobacter diazotrophicus]GEJ55368.1 acyl-CoA dehydrogenase [Anaeromyxobacter diazotrophicus]